MMRRLSYFVIAFLILGSPFAWARLLRPARTAVLETIQPGVVYEREVRTEPREIVIHTVAVDLTTPGLRFLVTPAEENGRYLARTTADFLAKFDLEVAINGSFYRFDRSDRDYLQPLGQTIANGIVGTASRRDWPVLCFAANNAITFAAEQCSAGTEQGIAGNVLLFANGEPVDLRRTYFPGRANSNRLEPRTAVALDQSGTKLWFVVVDGRRTGYSEGVTLPEFAQIIAELGAYQALNLDGGGSSTLVRAGWPQPRTLNAPAAYPIFPRQRPVATHLGLVIGR